MRLLVLCHGASAETLAQCGRQRKDEELWTFLEIRGESSGVSTPVESTGRRRLELDFGRMNQDLGTASAGVVRMAIPLLRDR